MDQLVVLQEIYESFSRGGDGLQKTNTKSIEGSCSDLVAGLLESTKKGRIDEEICRKLSDKLENVYEIKRVGDISLMSGFARQAAETYNRALSLCDDPVLRPVLQNNLGRSFAARGDLAKAVYYYEQASDCFSREGDKMGLAHVLGNMGSAYRQAGEWDKAIEYCYKSLKTFEDASDDRGAAQMTGSLGRIYADMGERDLAARYFERSLADFKSLGDQKSAAWVLDRMGRLAAQSREWDAAICHYHQSLSLFEQQGQSISQAVVLSNLGRVFLEIDEPDAAREPLERAVRLLPRHSRPGYQNALSALAATYYSLAEKSLQKAEGLEKANSKEDDGQMMDRSDDRKEAGSTNSAARKILPSEKARAEAARLFTLSADRYQELASSLPGSAEGRYVIKSAASLAKGRSYLAGLSGRITDEKALSLSERALSALSGAAAHSSGGRRQSFLSLLKIVSGMKETYNSGILASDSSRASRSLSNAYDNILESLRGREMISADANGQMRQSLESIKASIKSRPGGADGKDWQQTASQKMLLLAGALAGLSFQEIKGQEAAYAWDEKMRLLSASRRKELSGQNKKMIENAAEENITEEETANEKDANERAANERAANEKIAAAESNARAGSAAARVIDAEENAAADDISVGGRNLKKLVLADGTVEDAEPIPSGNKDPDEGWLIPMRIDMACRDSIRIPLAQAADRFQAEEDADKPSAPKAAVEIISVLEREALCKDDSVLPENDSLSDSSSAQKQEGNEQGDLDLLASEVAESRRDPVKPAAEAYIEEVDSPLHSLDGPDKDSSEPVRSDLQMEKEPKMGPFGLRYGLSALKGLTAVVLMLLAVEAVLRLI